MMTPGEKVIAVGVLSTMNLAMLLVSGFLAAGSLIATIPLATAILHQ